MTASKLRILLRPLGLCVFLLGTTPCAVGTTSQETPVALRDAALGLFEIGVGTSDRIAEQPDDWPLLTSQFDSVDPRELHEAGGRATGGGSFHFQRPISLWTSPRNINCGSSGTAWSGPRMIGRRRGSFATGTSRSAVNCSCNA